MTERDADAILWAIITAGFTALAVAAFRTGMVPLTLLPVAAGLIACTIALHCTVRALQEKR